MNIKKLLAATAILAATGSAFAQQTEFVAADANFTSTKTRAEVMAEVNQAYADGTLIARDGQEPVVAATATPRSREAVRAEARQANQGKNKL
jgi:hypothetical protein